MLTLVIIMKPYKEWRLQFQAMRVRKRLPRW